MIICLFAQLSHRICIDNKQIAIKITHIHMQNLTYVAVRMKKYPVKMNYQQRVSSDLKYSLQGQSYCVYFANDYENSHYRVL